MEEVWGAEQEELTAEAVLEGLEEEGAAELGETIVQPSFPYPLREYTGLLGVVVVVVGKVWEF
jgi:hypothetical protein